MQISPQYNHRKQTKLPILTQTNDSTNSRDLIGLLSFIRCFYGLIFVTQSPLILSRIIYCIYPRYTQWK